MRRLAAVMSVLLAAPGAAELPGEREGNRLAEAVHGVWDMTKRADHPWPLLMILRRAEHRYPSYWIGRNTAGVLTVRGQYDLLNGLKIEAEGGLTGTFLRTDNRVGMRGKVPGGVWADRLQDGALRVELKSFRDFRLVPDKTQKGKAEGVTFQATCKVALHAPGDHAVELEATGEFFFHERISSWSFAATFTVQGGELGLTGDDAGELQVQISTRSSVSKVKPTPTPLEIEITE